TREGQIGPGEHITIELKEEYDMLDDVVVTGQYAPKKSDQSIYKIDVVDNKSMEQRGVNNLADALSQESNIRLTSDGAFGSSIELQGMSGENVKYLIDGVPITGRVGGKIDLSQINMDNVDHVEIVQGPMSVVYGTSAIAGVINIITKKNTTKKYIAKVNGYADTKDNYKVGFLTSVKLGKHTISATGSRNMFQGQDLELDEHGNVDGVNNRKMEFNPKLVYNGDLGYTFRNNDFNLNVKSSIMNSELRYYDDYDYDLVNNTKKNALDRYFITLRNINSVNISDRLSESLSYNIVGAYTFFTRDDQWILADLEELTHKKGLETSTTFHNIMTRGNFTRTKEDSKISYQFGWDINHDNGTGERIDDDKAKITDYAIFASAQWNPFEKMMIQPGLRYFYNSSFDNKITPVYIFGHKLFDAPLIPSVNLQYQFIKDLNFRVSYAKGFRAPTLKELYLDFHDSNHNLSGNPDLKPETTHSYNGSLTYKLKSENHIFKFEPSVFYNDGEDAIVLVVTNPDENAAENQNFGLRRTFGANFNASYYSFKGLTLSAGYSMTREKTRRTKEESWIDPGFYDNITLTASYNYDKWNTTVMANYKYYGETPHIYGDGDLVFNVFTEAYSDFELTLSKQLLKKRLNVVVGGKNLFDNYVIRSYGDHNYESFSPRNYGRNFFIKANFKLTK
ncbi:MAG: TonB-dependent receptor, partial [Bacteroidota bacterium]